MVYGMGQIEPMEDMGKEWRKWSGRSVVICAGAQGGEGASLPGDGRR